MKQYKDGRGARRGWLSDDGIYRIDMDRKKVRLAVVSSEYSIDQSIVNDLRSEDCKEIRVRERYADGTTVILLIDMEDFMERSTVAFEKYWIDARHFAVRSSSV